MSFMHKWFTSTPMTFPWRPITTKVLQKLKGFKRLAKEAHGFGSEPSGAGCVFWWIERRERKSCRRHCLILME